MIYVFSTKIKNKQLQNQVTILLKGDFLWIRSKLD